MQPQGRKTPRMSAIKSKVASPVVVRVEAGVVEAAPAWAWACDTATGLLSIR